MHRPPSPSKEFSGSQRQLGIGREVLKDTGRQDLGLGSRWLAKNRVSRHAEKKNDALPRKEQGMVDAMWKMEQPHACTSQDTGLFPALHRRAPSDSHVYLEDSGQNVL